MASSSKAKKKHTYITHKKQGTSSSEANPLDLARLLANDEQRKVFTEIFLGRPIFAPEYGHLSNFELDDFHTLLRQQNLFAFCEESNAYYPELVTETAKSRDILAVGNLNLEDRLLHYILSYVIIPKYSNHSQINDIELQFMYALKHNLEINWDLTVMNHLWSARETNNPLPYSIIISIILENFGVSTVGESKITLNACDIKIDVDVIHIMGFFRDLTDKIYKHRSGKLVDPTTNVYVNPHAQQPSDFHTESSSSACMPSNQIIMDEICSLRGYISNRMDARDAQNQQVQIELQRLSYKINMMDLDALWFYVCF
ncbi:hypothetical protein Lal_00039916 [Lupinus albus]|nr:hypothetical protein Lal_00039916 [Lupinus albus]